MSLLKSALQLAEKGFHVFPLVENSKIPLIKDFPNIASKDPETIKAWWVDEFLDLEQNYNIGISTTSYNCTQALIVVDVDNKKDKNGSDELLKLEMQGFDVESTYTQTTPTGGEHLVFLAQNAVKQGVNVLARGLDIRSRGGYIVGAGSKINGDVYLGNDESISECPTWISKKCGEPIEKNLREIDVSNINEDVAISRAKDYLKTADIALEGDGGTQTTFKVSAYLKDLGLSPENNIDLLLEWNESCEPPWEVEDLEKIVDSVYRYGKEPVGLIAPESDFEALPEEIKDKSYLEKLNDRYALVIEDGGHSILEETVDEQGRLKRKFYSEATFKRKLSTKTVMIGDKFKKQADIWLDWEGRREYNGLCFKPEQDAKNGYYNLWKGFTCKPKPYAQASSDAKKGFDMYMSHIEENMCDGNAEHFKWIMGYFAHLIQKPYEKPLVTLVFKGSKGVGKNVAIDRMGKLIGANQYLVAHNSRYLTSNFNGHMDSCLCLVLDEAFWSGDKGAEGVLKGLTTSPEIQIERKGKEPYMVNNYIRFIIIGNEEWLVPASADERRYGVFQVGDGRKKDVKFFSEMVRLMDTQGGLEILLDYLKKFDLSQVEVNVAPNTKALQEQKELSLDALDQYWEECLDEGRIYGTTYDFGLNNKISKTDFSNAIYAYLKNRNIGSWRPTKRAIGLRLRKWLPSLDNTGWVGPRKDRLRAYELNTLESCRDNWDKYLNGS